MIYDNIYTHGQAHDIMHIRIELFCNLILEYAFYHLKLDQGNQRHTFSYISLPKTSPQGITLTSRRCHPLGLSSRAPLQYILLLAQTIIPFIIKEI